jgi:D-sedoheptulose 7-phosphate isomerase
MTLKKDLENSIKLHKKILKEKKNLDRIISIITSKLLNKGKIFLCGNGGSAADAQHLAAEFLVRLKPKNNRLPIPAISLNLDTSTLTACGNDYNFNKIFTRNLSAIGSNKDILIAISTSGMSKNIIDVLKFAKKNSIYSFGLLGSNGGIAAKICDSKIIIRTKDVARAQECHMFLGHYIFQEIEKKLMKKKFV